MRSEAIVSIVGMDSGVMCVCMVGIMFVGELLQSFSRLLRGRARMRWIDVWNEIIKAGPNALFIVCLIGFLANG